MCRAFLLHVPRVSKRGPKDVTDSTQTLLPPLRDVRNLSEPLKSLGNRCKTLETAFGLSKSLFNFPEAGIEDRLRKKLLDQAAVWTKYVLT